MLCQRGFSGHTTLAFDVALVLVVGLHLDAAAQTFFCGLHAQQHAVQLQNGFGTYQGKEYL